MTNTTDALPDVAYFLATVDPARSTSGEPAQYIPHNPVDVYAVYKAHLSRYVVTTLPDRYVKHGVTFTGAWPDRESAERFGRSMGQGKEGVGYAVSECQPYYYDRNGCGFVPRCCVIETEEKRAALTEACKATWANRERAWRRYSAEMRMHENIRSIREAGMDMIRAL